MYYKYYVLQYIIIIIILHIKNFIKNIFIKKIVFQQIKNFIYSKVKYFFININYLIM